jgi:hypothetical protein
MFLVTGNTVPQTLYYAVVLPLAARAVCASPGAPPAARRSFRRRRSLRAGLATNAALAGVAERAIMAQTRHKSLPMVRRYVGMDRCSGKAPPPRLGFSRRTASARAGGHKKVVARIHFTLATKRML